MRSTTQATDSSEATLSRVVEQRDVKQPGTRNNNGCGVSAVPEAGECRSRREVVAAIERGIADVHAGHVIDDEEFQREVDAEFGPLA